MRVGLLNIATGKYDRFLPGIVASSREHFMRGHQVVNIVLTDSVSLAPEERTIWDERMACFRVAHTPWPGPTLHRYRMMLQIADWIRENTDYLFYCDVDMRFVSPVGDEILGDLVASIHPGFWDKPRFAFTYESRPQSRACIYPHEGRRYYAGGFQGGRTDRFLEVIERLADWIDDDARRGITAVWHDESFWNRALATTPPDVELNPGYCYPESWSLPFTKRLLALDKNHQEMRS